MTYQVETELKSRAKKAGLTGRELAEALGEPPGTTGNRLNGFLPLSHTQRLKIVQVIEQAEKEKEELAAA